MVKCKLCGEIFDDSLTTCPLCGVGPDYFEPVETESAGQVRCSICQAVFDGSEPVCPFCNVGPEYYVPLEDKPGGMVRCKVCQAVFDGSEPVCPVCNVGPENFEPLDSAPVTGKVRCDVCQAVFDGSEPVCPFCNVGPEHYVPVDQGQPAGKVRCTICKEVFDASENSCPVCGVGPEYFEPVVEKPAGGKVRCTVCQEIFDASEPVCPVCGVGPEHFVPVEPQKTGKVKCAICGEIFDASEPVCPVCGVGPEHYLPVEEAEAIQRHDTDRRYLILGAGTAAVNAAQAIRDRDGTGTITLLADEEELPYKRPQLTKHMFDGTDAEARAKYFTLHDQAWYAERNITLALGKKIVSLNPAEKRVTLEDGAVCEYDKCIYALGSHFFVPPFGGNDDPRVKTIRTIRDIEEIRTFLEKGKRAVVIGGGVVGLEAAWELKQYGCDVTVLEAMPALMANKLDPVASAMLQGFFEEGGVKILAGAMTDRYENGTIYLKDGTALPAEVVVVSAGVRANGQLAADAGAEQNKAVVVNERMETSLPDLYGAGDCVEFAGMNYALWPEASRQGEVAGANAAGDQLTFAAEIYGMSMEVAGRNLYTIGKASGAGEAPLRTVEFRDDARGNLEKYFFQDDVLCGVTLLGDVSKLSQVTEQVNRKASYDSLFGK